MVKIQREAVFNNKHMEDVHFANRHVREPIAADVWATALDKLKSDSPMSFQPSDWDFDDESRWMYSCFMSKLSTSLFDVLSNAQDQNGLEIIRPVNDHMDRAPENATFHFNYQLGETLREKGSKFKFCKNTQETSSTVCGLDKTAIKSRRQLV